MFYIMMDETFCVLKETSLLLDSMCTHCTHYTLYTVQLRIRNHCELSSYSPNRPEYCKSKYCFEYSHCNCALSELLRNF